MFEIAPEALQLLLAGWERGQEGYVGVDDRLDEDRAVGTEGVAPRGVDVAGMIDLDSREAEQLGVTRIGKSGRAWLSSKRGSPSISRCSQVTSASSRLWSTRTTNLGSSQLRHSREIVISSATPFICMAPSPLRGDEWAIREGKLGGKTVGEAGPHGGQGRGEMGGYAPRQGEVPGVPVRHRADVDTDLGVRR
jgi:hypothetical protein